MISAIIAKMASGMLLIATAIPIAHIAETARSEWRTNIHLIFFKKKPPI